MNKVICSICKSEHEESCGLGEGCAINYSISENSFMAHYGSKFDMYMYKVLNNKVAFNNNADLICDNCFQKLIDNKDVEKDYNYLYRMTD